jgi:nucleotide-binding universal stress UspA family protein
MTKAVPHRVVVGVDGSPNSVAALHLAMSEALRRHAELDIVHLIAPDASNAQVSGAADMLRDIVSREFPGRRHRGRAAPGRTRGPGADAAQR